MSEHRDKQSVFHVWWKDIYTWVTKQELSFLAYTSTILLLFLSAMFVSNKFSSAYLVFTSSIVTLLLFGVIWDSVNILIKYKSTVGGVILLFSVTVLLYFINVQSESLSHQLIASATGEKAQYFPEVSNYFEAIFMPVAFLFIFLKNLDSFMTIMTLLLFLSTIGLFLNEKYRKASAHLFFYTFAIILLIIMFSSNNEKIYESFYGKNYIPSKIIEYSYHQNTSCENFDDEVYINFLYKDIVSVTNMKELKFGKSIDKNITFSTKKCIKKELVSRI